MDAFNFRDILELLQDVHGELEELSELTEKLPDTLGGGPSLRLRERVFEAIAQLERRCL